MKKHLPLFGLLVLMLTVSTPAHSQSPCNFGASIIQTPDTAVYPRGTAVTLRVSVSGISYWWPALQDSTPVQQVNDNCTTTYCVELSDNSCTGIETLCVTINRTGNPVAVCQPDTVILDQNGFATLDAGGVGGLTSTRLDGGSYDACGGVTFTIAGKLNFDCSDIGHTYPETLQVTNEEGNTSFCNTAVTIFGSASPLQITGITKSSYGAYNLRCYGDCNGSATVNLSNACSIGTTYEWNNGQIGPVAVNLCAGTYSVTVTGSNGGITVTSTTLTQPPATAFTVSAGTDRSVYLGYAPAACTDVNATSAGGNSPISFVWSTGATSAYTNVCPVSLTAYCVTATEANGCTTSDCVSVCVNDIRCDVSKNKVFMCQQNNRGVLNTLCVATNTVPSLLARGYWLGSCGQTDCLLSTKNTEEVEEMMMEITEVEGLLNIYPNPATNSVTISIDESMLHGTATLTDVTGRKMTAVQLQTVNSKLQTENFSSGVYFVTIESGKSKATQKLIITK